MEITMCRGDTSYRRFTVYEPDESISTIDFDEIYFTVKHSARSDDFLLQKRLSDGGITKDGDGYKFVILPEDTDGLSFDTYAFDIEVYLKDPELKQTFVGDLIIKPEVTYAGNEG